MACKCIITQLELVEVVSGLDPITAILRTLVLPAILHLSIDSYNDHGGPPGLEDDIAKLLQRSQCHLTTISISGGRVFVECKSLRAYGEEEG